MDDMTFVYCKQKKLSKIRLFCFPFAGSGASYFNDWHNKFPPEIEIFPIQLPGRENRMSEKSFINFSELQDWLIEVISPYLDKPFAIFGHSMGSLIGYELINKIQMKYKKSPLYFFPSGGRTPNRINNDYFLHTLDDAEFIEALIKFGGIPELILKDKNVLNFFLSIIRVDFKLIHSYKYTANGKLPCPITIFSGKDDRIVSFAQVKEWETFTDDHFRIKRFFGKHFFINTYTDSIIKIIINRLLAID